MAAMSNLSMMEAKLPPGFRFHPQEEELICDYLAKKASGAPDDGSGSCSLIIDVDLNKCEPWDLPEMACVGGKEWYFFNLRDRKYSTGQRMNRATQSSYWKATGKDRQVSRRGVLVGMRKTLVFYQGRAPKGKKTDWVMHEFRMEGTTQLTKFSFKEDWVLCRVFYKSRSGGGDQASKLRMEPPCYHDVASSSHLHPLMDTFMVLDQAHQSVYCFSSNLPQKLTPQSKAAGAEFPAQLKNTQSSFLGAALEDHLGHGENKVVLLKAVVDDFTKLEASPQGEVLPCVPQEKLESYFADHGVVPHMWNPF